MWLRLVGRGQDLGLVDVVDAERLEDLGLDEVADAGLGHDRDGHRVHDPLDHRRVAHAGDAAGRADVGGHALEGHHGDGAGILGDLGLVGRDDVHDDAALEHLGEALLGRPGGRFDGHVGLIPLVVALGSPAGSGPGVVARSSRPGPSRAPDYRTSADEGLVGIAGQSTVQLTAGTRWWSRPRAQRATVRMTPDISFVARRAAVGRQAAERLDELDDVRRSGSPPSRSDERAGRRRPGFAEQAHPAFELARLELRDQPDRPIEQPDEDDEGRSASRAARPARASSGWLGGGRRPRGRPAR